MPADVERRFALLDDARHLDSRVDHQDVRHRERSDSRPGFITNDRRRTRKIKKERILSYVCSIRIGHVGSRRAGFILDYKKSRGIGPSSCERFSECRRHIFFFCLGRDRPEKTGVRRPSRPSASNAARPCRKFFHI